MGFKSLNKKQEQEYQEAKELFRQNLPATVFKLMVETTKLAKTGLPLSFELKVDAQFPVVDFVYSKGDYPRVETVDFATVEEWELEQVTTLFQTAAADAEEERRKREMRKAALAKLTPEEIKLLKISVY